MDVVRPGTGNKHESKTPNMPFSEVRSIQIAETTPESKPDPRSGQPWCNAPLGIAIYTCSATPDTNYQKERYDCMTRPRPLMYTLALCLWLLLLLAACDGDFTDNPLGY